MDFNQHNKLINSTWNFARAIEEPNLCHQNSFNSLWPNYALQTHQAPSSSIHISSTNEFSDRIGSQLEEEEEPDEELGAMKEMMYKIAAMQPVDIDPATIRKPKRRNVRISDDPQSVAARHRRERISEKIRILQRLVPGGTKMDTASMLDEAIRYVKFLKRQIRLLQSTTPSQGTGMTTGNLDPPEWAFTLNKPHGSTFSPSVNPPAGPRSAFVGNHGETVAFNPEVISD